MSSGNIDKKSCELCYKKVWWFKETKSGF